MVSILAFVAIFAVCGLMLWASYKIEPHWVSKDGERLICYGQGMTARGEPIGRWREVRVSRAEHGCVEVRTRRGSLAMRERPSDTDVKFTKMGTIVKERGARASIWRVGGASSEPPPRKRVYLLDGNSDAGMPELLAIRVPATSRAISMLEELAVNKASGAPGATAAPGAPTTPGATDDPSARH